MTIHYPIVLETEVSGAVSAYVPGLPVYAVADSHAKAERAIRAVLRAYLEAHPTARSHVRVRVARLSDRHTIDVVGIGALLGGVGAPGRRAPPERMAASGGGHERPRAERLERRQPCAEPFIPVVSG